MGPARSVRALSTLLVVILTVGAVAGLSACAGSGGVASASMVSNERPASGGGPSELPDDPDEPALPDVPDIDDMPGIDELPDIGDLPGIGDIPEVATECMDLLSSYLELTMLGVFGSSPEEIERSAAQVRSALPEELHDDLDTVVEILIEASRAGIIEGPQMLLTDEYNAANDRIMEWLGSQCSGTGTFTD